MMNDIICGVNLFDQRGTKKYLSNHTRVAVVVAAGKEVPTIKSLVGLVVGFFAFV